MMKKMERWSDAYSSAGNREMNIQDQVDSSRTADIDVDHRRLCTALLMLAMAGFCFRHWQHEHGGCGQYQRKEGQRETGDRMERNPPSSSLPPRRREEKQEQGQQRK